MMISGMRAGIVLAVLFAALADAASLLAQASPDPRAIAAVDTVFSEASAGGLVGGMTVGIVSGAELAWTKSYGYADMDAKIPATRHTVYRIGSITKQFTAVMLLQLVEQGKVTLADPVERYVPEIVEIPARGAERPQPTLLQLAVHRSGLSREPSNRSFLIGASADWEKTLRAALPTVSYERLPGERYGYSNVGFALLGLALGQAAGEPYTAYVERAILKPLGLESTAFEPTPAMKEALAKGYLIGAGGRVDATLSVRELEFGRGYKMANGALFSTVGDLAKFLAFEMGLGPAGVLRPETIRENFAQSTLIEGTSRVTAGAGFFTRPVGLRTVFGHNGVVAGYTADAFFEPNSKLGLIFLRNVSYASNANSNLVFRAMGALLSTQ
jgi:CubicO group peptidase (beta-lactamase class C family)